MKKLIENIKKYPRTYLIISLVSIVVGVIIFLLFFYLNYQSLVDAINGVTVAGIVLLSAGLLSLLARFGAYDTFSYGFSQMFASFFNRQANKYNDMVDYKEKKDASRKAGTYYYVPLIVIGLLFFIALIVLEIVKSTLI